MVERIYSTRGIKQVYGMKDYWFYNKHMVIQYLTLTPLKNGNYDITIGTAKHYSERTFIENITLKEVKAVAKKYF